MAAELIGYIYSIDRRLSYVMKNGETLILDSGSHITSHTDAEIIAAPVPINITYTTGDTALKCMYVPKSYLDKQTHVPVSIFLKEAHAIRELLAAKVPGRVFFGVKVVSADSGEALLFDDAEFRSEFGRSYDNARDVVLAMNGDSVNGGYFAGVTYYSGSKRIWVGGSGINPGPLRVCYVVLLGD